MTSIKRVAVVFDDERRPETTGAYCLRALRRLVTVEHFRPAALERIDANAFDLFLQVDDGLDYRIPHRLSPSAYWAIDTHVDFVRPQQRGPGFGLEPGVWEMRARRLITLGCDTMMPGIIAASGMSRQTN